MKLDNRERWLCGTPFLVLLLMFSAVWGVRTWQRLHPRTVTTTIGPFNNQHALDHAVLQTLNAQITEFPAAVNYDILLWNKAHQSHLLLRYRLSSSPDSTIRYGEIFVSPDIHSDWGDTSVASDFDIHEAANLSDRIQSLLCPRF